MPDIAIRAQIPAIQEVDLDSMDLESAMMFVQTKRAENMEIQLRDQLKEVQARNEKNAKLNEILQALVAIANSLKTGAKNEEKIGDEGYKVGKDLIELAKKANMDISFFKKIDTTRDIAKANEELQKWTKIAEESQANLDSFYKNPKSYVNGNVGGELTPQAKLLIERPLKSALANAHDKVAKITEQISDLKFAAEGALSKSTTKGEIETAISKIKGQLDTNNSSNQLDMLRLQSLNSKRNEAFELLTNFIKKMQESRLSVISNMR